MRSRPPMLHARGRLDVRFMTGKAIWQEFEIFGMETVAGGTLEEVDHPFLGRMPSERVNTNGLFDLVRKIVTQQLHVLFELGHAERCRSATPDALQGDTIVR